MKLCLALILLFNSLTANAWSAIGHQATALIAQSHLSPAASAGVARLLALEPGETLSSLSMWADAHRNPTTAAWHYVNFPRDSCDYDATRDCPDGKCVVGAIERQTAVLGSSAPDGQRLLALKYLVHLMADVHQPLHAGVGDDKGGNTYQLQFNGRGSNLHRVWDGELIKRTGNTPEDLVAAIASMGIERAPGVFADKSALLPASAAKMAEESCRIVSKEGFYPGRHVDDDYITTFTPVALKQLDMAGRRLAETLNRVLK